MSAQMPTPTVPMWFLRLARIQAYLARRELRKRRATHEAFYTEWEFKADHDFPQYELGRQTWVEPPEVTSFAKVVACLPPAVHRGALTAIRWTLK